jgi:hypothetical protein
LRFIIITYIDGFAALPPWSIKLAIDKRAGVGLTVTDKPINRIDAWRMAQRRAAGLI